MLRVHGLQDIPLLFTEGDDDMGAPKKTRAELLDKIIQFIWDYQDKHNGATPALGTIGQNVGVKPEGMGYYANILVEDGRIDRIAVRPFRATITDHIENKRAIARWKRLRERIEAHNAEERDEIRARQEAERTAQQRQSDKEAVFAAAADTVVADMPTPEPTKTADRPAIATNWDRQVEVDRTLSREAQAVQNLSEAQARSREVNREVKQLMPRLLKLADERDLVFELVSRGYTVKR